MKKKLVGAREERTALYVLRVQLLGLHLLRDGKKKTSESGFFTCHPICAKKCLFPGVYKIDKRVKNDGERAREIEIVN